MKMKRKLRWCYFFLTICIACFVCIFLIHTQKEFSAPLNTVIPIVQIHKSKTEVEKKLRSRPLKKHNFKIAKPNKFNLPKKEEPYWNPRNSDPAEIFRQEFRPFTHDISGADVSSVKYFMDRCSEIHSDNLTVMNCAYDSVMYQRSIKLRQGCNVRDENRTKVLDVKKFFVLTRRHLLWCPVFKAASTNWMKNLVKFSDRSPQYVSKLMRDPKKSQPNVLARTLFPLITKTRFKFFISDTPKPVSFIIVRHPFDRLLSAFRDKLEQYKKYYFNNYGKKITKLYRIRGKKRFGEAFYQKSGANGSPLPVTGRKGIEPTFWEFVSAVIERGTMNEHWKPATQLCSLCAKSIYFNFILKFENLREEEDYFLRRLNLTNVIKPRWENRSSEGISRKIRDAYFGMLNTRELGLLYKLYYDDFNLLGFTLDSSYSSAIPINFTSVLNHHLQGPPY